MSILLFCFSIYFMCGSYVNIPSWCFIIFYLHLHFVVCSTRYLIPCSHVMVSQRRAVRDLDFYGRSAQKFLSLTPACCTNVASRQTTPHQTPIRNKKTTKNRQVY